MTLFRKEAEEKERLIKNNKDKVFVIHYSCESFTKHSEKTPRVSSIAIRRYDTGKTHSFSINKIAELEYKAIEKLDECYDKFEKRMLDEFFSFLEEHMDYYYVHWNMRNINYGFEALRHRYKVLGGIPKDLNEERFIDLSKLLIDYYGEHYIGHPRLENLMQLNGISNKGFLKGKEEADCFDSGEYIRLHSSTLAKVDALCSILNKQLNGALKTNINKISQILNAVFESPLYKFLSIIAMLWTIISIPLFFSKR